MTGMALTDKQVSAALHTLWQAAVGSGGVGAIAVSASGNDISLSGVEQGAGVAAIAVAASALSLVKSAAINWYASHKNDRAVRDAVKLDALAKQVEALYEAKHSTAAPTSVPAPVA